MTSNRKHQDQWLARVTEALQVTPEQLANMSLDDLVERDISKRDAYAVRKLAVATIESEGADHSLAKRILSVLKNGPAKDIETIRSALFFAHEDMTASNQDITKAIWSLQKRSLVTFYERKAGRDSLLTAIKLTRQGMREMGLIAEHDQTKPGKVQPSRELKRPSKVGKDYTDASRHSHVAKGEEVEIVQKGTPPPPKETVYPFVERTVTPPPNGAPRDPLPQNMKSFTDERSGATHPSASASHPSASLRKRILSDTHTEYPTIKVVLEKADKQAAFDMAAEALDGVDDAMAADLRNRIKLTTLEDEVVRLVKEVG